MRERIGVEMTEQEVIDSLHIFIGWHDQFVEKFSELRERLGISSFLVGSLESSGRWCSAWPAPDHLGPTSIWPIR